MTSCEVGVGRVWNIRTVVVLALTTSAICCWGQDRPDLNSLPTRFTLDRRLYNSSPCCAALRAGLGPSSVSCARCEGGSL